MLPGSTAEVNRLMAITKIKNIILNYYDYLWMCTIVFFLFCLICTVSFLGIIIFLLVLIRAPQRSACGLEPKRNKMLSHLPVERRATRMNAA